jgi:glycosyltransferase involved in cell wall biosynthesis
MVEYSVLIPVYNEADILESKLHELMDFLDMYNPDYQIIVCSNGSTDRTEEIGGGLNNPKVRFIAIPERGVGRAFKRMVTEARSEKLVSIDVDLTSDLNFIPKCVKLLDEASIVIGSKKKGAQERKWYRLLISGVFISMVKLLIGLGYDDYSIGTKGWRRSDILEYVRKIDHGSSYVIELVYYVVKKDKKKVAEVPVYCSDNRGSKFNLIHEIFYRFRNLIALWWRVKVVSA